MSLNIRRALYLVTVAVLPFLVASGWITDSLSAALGAVLLAVLAPGVALAYATESVPATQRSGVAGNDVGGRHARR